MDDTRQFIEAKKERIRSYPDKAELQKSGHDFLMASLDGQYSYNFNWLGLPIFQYPQDIVAVQEIIWSTKPDLVIETGVARGGSLVLYASLRDAGGNGLVVGVDIDIRAHNRQRIISHPLSHRIRLIEGSSIELETFEAVRHLAEGKKRIMVSLDSNHTHDHVLRELELYAPLVSSGCYCLVFDTVIEDMPAGSFPDRPWGKGDNPKTAVKRYLEMNQDFFVDKEIENKLILTAAPSGYLKRK